MNKTRWHMIYVLIFSLTACLIVFRLYGKSKDLLDINNEVLYHEIEYDIKKNMHLANINQIKRHSPLGLVDHIPPYLMASIIRTGKDPSHGLLKESYKSGYDPVVEPDIMIPELAGYKIYFDRLLMLYSAGADGLFGTEDDIGIAVESKAVDDAMIDMKDAQFIPTLYDFP